MQGWLALLKTKLKVYALKSLQDWSKKSCIQPEEKFWTLINPSHLSLRYCNESTKIPYGRHYNPLLIRNRSGILTIHTGCFMSKCWQQLWYFWQFRVTFMVSRVHHLCPIPWFLFHLYCACSDFCQIPFRFMSKKS